MKGGLTQILLLTYHSISLSVWHLQSSGVFWNVKYAFSKSCKLLMLHCKVLISVLCVLKLIHNSQFHIEYFRPSWAKRTKLWSSALVTIGTRIAWRWTRPSSPSPRRSRTSASSISLTSPKSQVSNIRPINDTCQNPFTGRWKCSIA